MRSKLQIRIAITMALWLAMAQAAAAQVAQGASARVRAVAAVSTTVSNMDRAVAFYSRVLTFEVVSDHELREAGERIVRLRLGNEEIELVHFRARTGQPVPRDSRSNDLWFQHVAIIVSDMDRAYAVLKANDVEPASVAPQRLPEWNQNAAGIRAFYFNDPDGHPLEILQFPAGKGDPRWQRSDRLFLGIDHTAIVVSDTAATVQFYRDVLGMRVAGTSENYGPEQEALNNVRGAHLRITTLRAARGPGIELLEYVAPRNGRRLPFTPSDGDLVHRHTVVLAENPAAFAELARAAKRKRHNEVIVHDPDGHELRIQMADPETKIGEVK